MNNPNHLNISTVGLGFSLEGNIALLPQVYNRQSSEAGSINGIIITPSGMRAVLNQVAYYIENEICLDLMLDGPTVVRLQKALRTLSVIEGK